MNILNLEEVKDYVNQNIGDFHDHRIKSLQELHLEKLLKKNPYLFKAKDITTAGDLISSLLDAFLSSSEEKIFGDFLEGLAIFVAEKTCNGHKSSAQGIDLEFFNNDTHYIVSVKSGPNWGNSSQQKKLQEDFQTAVKRLRQSAHSGNLQPVLGICYGKTKTSYLRGYLKIIGQSFWYLISENKDLYIDIIEPIGFRAKEHNEKFFIEKSKIINRFTKQFIDRFCDASGLINWGKLVEFNSGNLELGQSIP